MRWKSGSVPFRPAPRTGLVDMNSRLIRLSGDSGFDIELDIELPEDIFFSVAAEFRWPY